MIKKTPVNKIISSQTTLSGIWAWHTCCRLQTTVRFGEPCATDTCYGHDRKKTKN